MRRPTPSELALVLTGAGLAALLVWLDPAAGLAEWVFGTFLFALAGIMIRTAALAALRARTERAHARLLEAARPDEVARQAIQEERRRLSMEIVASLRRMMLDVVAEVEALDSADPVPGLRRIHRRTQLATSELRRHLGLLRSPDPGGDEVVAQSATSGVVPRRDVALAGALSLLATVEVTAYLLTEGPQTWLPWSAALSGLAAACVLGRTAAPAAACVLCAAVFLGASLAGYPVLGGFWSFGTLGYLLWSVATRTRVVPRELMGGALLVAVVVWTRHVSDPDNLPIVVMLMSAAVTAALLVRTARTREARARERATLRESELLSATREAVSAERVGFARDLHDVVSHAVGLIALQSSAAQVSWPHDPEGVHRSVAVIGTTARSTLEELDRLVPGDHPEPGAHDLVALVDRIRATGTPVSLSVEGELPASCSAVVHRVLQESLTNAVRHAPGAAVRATVSRAGHQVIVRVSDEGAGARSGATRGYGLVGLTERVGLAGGTLTAGAGPDGGFRVEVVLPATSAEVTS